MDIYTLIVTGHVIGTILGTGGATLAELQIVRALRDNKVSPDESGLMHVNYGMIRVGMGILLLSVIAMFWYFHEQGSSYLFTNEKLWIKDLMFIMIFINAVALHKRWVPLWLGASTSFTSWWGATLLGLAGALPYSFITYFIGYIAMILVVAGVSHLLRNKNNNFNMKNKKAALIAITVLAIMAFVAHQLINTHPAKEREIAPAMEEKVVLRELSSIVEYDAPGIVHKVEFSIFIDEEGTIQDVDATELTHEGYEEKLGLFSDKLTTIIKGKKLADLEAVDKVGTSSITTAGFNEALEEIKTKI